MGRLTFNVSDDFEYTIRQIAGDLFPAKKGRLTDAFELALTKWLEANKNGYTTGLLYAEYLEAMRKSGEISEVKFKIKMKRLQMQMRQGKGK